MVVAGFFRMKVIVFAAMIGGLLVAGCGRTSTASPSSHTNAVPPASSVASNTAAAHPAPGGYLGALVQADKSAVKTIDVSYLNQAVQLFQTQEGRLPKDLNELTPNYVAKLPTPPYGYRIDYDSARGLVTVVQQ